VIRNLVKELASRTDHHRLPAMVKGGDWVPGWTLVVGRCIKCSWRDGHTTVAVVSSVMGEETVTHFEVVKDNQ
jgi:hypothetical protein